MIHSKKAQESGTLQSILMALLVMTTVAYFAVGYLEGVSTNYGVELNESEYAVFQQFDEVNANLEELTDQFIDDDGRQTEDSDIITVMLTSAYGLIKIVFDLPDIFFSLITSAVVAIGASPEQAGAVVGLGVGAIIILILFAVIALVMKVRA